MVWGWLFSGFSSRCFLGEEVGINKNIVPLTGTAAKLNVTAIREPLIEVKTNDRQTR